MGRRLGKFPGIKKLSPTEIADLRKAVTLHRPDLLLLVDSIVNVRLLTEDEREALRMAVAYELTTSSAGRLDAHGLEMDDLISRLGEISEWN